MTKNKKNKLRYRLYGHFLALRICRVHIKTPKGEIKMKSIMEAENGPRCCYFCGATQRLEKHHIFGGSLRKKSEQYGLTVTLCHDCHNEPPHGVHFDAERNNRLKADAQTMCMLYNAWENEDFIRHFYKSYTDNERSVKS